MASPEPLELQLHDAGQTAGLGAALAHSAPWGSPQPLTLFLEGHLGAGKTTLARGLLRALGVVGPVRSPSYTLLEQYEAAGHSLLHLDLYRLNGAAELEALGIRDELEPGAMLLVEWPERAAGGLPVPDLTVALAMSGAQRRAEVRSSTPVGSAWLESLRQQPMAPPGGAEN